ncbi:unnamed protein product [Blepharisma stoltei]|uniref:Uncharacterized protein n=1 Tax=Blepharisma stoltei TaxID=1481888 RepID=A0AAU9KDY6_9CILI|nr:unnamed protein product [Blepharisma stoltei]
METSLVSSSQIIDSQILTKLLQLISKNHTLSKLLNKHSNKSKKVRRTIHRKSSSLADLNCPVDTKISVDMDMTFSVLTETCKNRFKLEEFSNSKTFHNRSPSLYSLDQYWTMDIIFHSLIDKYKTTSWTRDNKGEPEAHRVIVKQLWLDCYASDSHFWSLLTDPIEGLIWVNSDNFIKCLENLQESSSWNIFTPKIFAKKNKKSLRVQRQLFFFLLIQSENQADLNKEALIQVFDMSEKSAKHHLEMLANMMLKKCGENVEKISFQKFLDIIIKTTYKN